MASENDSGRPKSRPFSRLGILWLLVVAGMTGAAIDFQLSLERPLRLEKPLLFLVQRGSGLAAVTRQLEKLDILPNPIWFKLLAYRHYGDKGLRYGEYEIRPGETSGGLMEMLLSGRTHQIPLTFVEGWTFTQMLAVMAKHPLVEHDSQGKSPQEIMALLGLPDELPEGRFFPDTFLLDSPVSDLKLLRLSHEEMVRVLEAEWRERADGLPLKTPYEALILASIIEKETGQVEERPVISGVFIRRLRTGMRLQTDPSVIYGLAERFDGDIRKADLRLDTPFNTYKRAGLPPTPIAMPGRAAIHAALHPAEGDSLYFVARGDGGHVFSASLKEHEEAVERYQRSGR